MNIQLQRGIRTVLLGAVLASTSLQPACFGSFSLTRKLHAWNDSLGNKFVETLVFWGLLIIPVYGLFTLGDGIIFNVIEFWTGSNPVASATPRDDGGVEWNTPAGRYALVPTGERSFRVLLDEVEVGAGIIGEDGSLALTDTAGQRSIHLTEKDAEAAHQALAQRE